MRDYSFISPAHTFAADSNSEGRNDVQKADCCRPVVIAAKVRERQCNLEEMARLSSSVRGPTGASIYDVHIFLGMFTPSPLSVRKTYTTVCPQICCISCSPIPPSLRTSYIEVPKWGRNTRHQTSNDGQVVVEERSARSGITQLSADFQKEGGDHHDQPKSLLSSSPSSTSLAPPPPPPSS